MGINDKLQQLLDEQNQITKHYEEILLDLSYDQLVGENENLKNKLLENEKKLNELDKKYIILEEQYLNLKMAFNQQLLDEKSNILYNSKKKIQLYFDNKSEANVNKLNQLEINIKQKLEKLNKAINKEGEEDNQIFQNEISQIYNKLETKIKEKKQDYLSQEKDIKTFVDENYADLKDEGISEEVIKKKQKHNDIEIKIGLNVLNKIGIIIILIGVITAMKYSYSNWFNEYVKGISVYILGLLFLGAGEILYKKNKKVFSQGLIGGGIGVLYIATFISYFTYNIIDFLPSLLVSVIITAASLILTLRYKAKTICAVSLVGGYLPFFSYIFTSGIEGEAVYIAMMYLLLLNILVLSLSFRKRWISINYLSFLLNIPSMLILIDESQNNVISIIYTLVVFAMYIIITLAYPLKQGVKLSILDIILLGLNTLIKSLILYELFDEDYRGLIALIFVLIYVFLAELVKRKGENEKKVEAIFYITALTFAVLMIPFQFGIKWLFLGWIIEGVALIYVSKRLNEKGMEIAGWVIWGLSFSSFLIDTAFWSDYYYDLKFAINTFAQLFILSMYLPDFESITYRNSFKGTVMLVYKYYVLIFAWLFMIYEICSNINFIEIHEDFFYLVIIGIITMLYGYLISKIKVLGDKGINIFVIILYIIGDVIAFGAILYPIAGNTPTEILGVVIIILYNILVFFNIKDLLFRLIKGHKMGYQLYPLLLGVYVLTSSVGFIITQLDLGRINLFISIFIVLMALVYLIIGFYKNFIFLRRFGLGIAVFALGKLFLFDLSYLDLLGKIIAYFAFGTILLGMSFVYQKIKNELERD